MVDERNAGLDPESAARELCLGWLALRPHTRAELAGKLARKRVPADAAEAVLSRLGEVGLVDDDAFAQAWVSTRHAGRGLARRALASELRQRGVSPETVDDALGALDPDTEAATARALVRRRLPALERLPVETRARRLAGLLARKGYPAGLAARVVRAALGEVALPAAADDG